MRPRKRLAILVLAVSMTSALALTQAVEARRRYHRARTGSEMIIGRWQGYREAMTTRPRHPINWEAVRARRESQRPYYQETAATTTQRRPDPGLTHDLTRSVDGALTERQVMRFRRLYADGQSRQALRSALGTPAQSEHGHDVWLIKRIEIDGKDHGRTGRFVAEYNSDGTAKPVRAEW